MTKEQFLAFSLPYGLKAEFTNTFGEVSIGELDGYYVDGYLFDEELVLLSEDGANITDRNYPVCFLASGKYWVNNHAHVLRTKDGNENKFICNSLERKDYKQKTQQERGERRPKTSWLN